MEKGQQVELTCVCSKSLVFLCDYYGITHDNNKWDLTIETCLSLWRSCASCGCYGYKVLLWLRGLLPRRQISTTHIGGEYIHSCISFLVQKRIQDISCPLKSEPSLTFADACGEVISCAPTTKRLAHVAPEVDLGECTLHLPLQKVNKAEPTLALNPRGDVTRNPKQWYQWPQKRTYVCQKLSKKKKKKKKRYQFYFLSDI